MIIHLVRLVDKLKCMMPEIVFTCNPSTPEMEAERLGALGQPGLHRRKKMDNNFKFARAGIGIYISMLFVSLY